MCSIVFAVAMHCKRPTYFASCFHLVNTDVVKVNDGGHAVSTRCARGGPRLGGGGGGGGDHLSLPPSIDLRCTAAGTLHRNIRAKPWDVATALQMSRTAGGC